MENKNTDMLIDFTENEIGNYLKINREARGYLLREVCDGICSEATLFRIESGKKNVDFLMIETFLSRMKIERTEYESVLDEEDYCAYKQRETIEVLVKNMAYGQAEKRMAAYERQYGTEMLHGQFLSFQKASLERTKPQPKWQQVKTLFQKALTITAPDWQKKFEQKEILSNLELSCITELLYCTENSLQREKEYANLYEYFTWSCRREGFFPIAYRTAMQYYGECLYENGKYEKCIQICEEALQELFKTSKVENREEIFLLKSKAREKSQPGTEEEKALCLKDLLTAYHLRSFFKGEDKAEDLKQYIGENYGWQFVDPQIE